MEWFTEQKLFCVGLLVILDELDVDGPATQDVFKGNISCKMPKEIFSQDSH